MIARRSLLAFGGLLGVAPTDGAPVAGEEQEVSQRDVQDVVKSLDSIRGELARAQTFGELAQLREQQRQFLRTHSKFPDFIDVGVDVWFTVYDWHVKRLQPMTIGRDKDGRYTIMLMFTTLIMRTDMMLNYVGPPYDKN